MPEVLVQLGAGEPAVPQSMLPPCECDACDEGSDALLKEFDEKVLAVVTGTFAGGRRPRGGPVIPWSSAPLG